MPPSVTSRKKSRVKPVGLEGRWALAVSACAIPETDLNMEGGTELGDAQGSFLSQTILWFIRGN